jgi:nitrate reductase beta subunit
LFLDPHAAEVQAQARADGVPEAWINAAQESPVYKMAMEWKVALPLHPEYRTLPMVWYVPPLSPITAAANSGQIGAFGQLPDVRSLRIPLQYLANLLTAGDETPVVAALERMLAMRAYMRDRHVEQRENAAVLKQVGLSKDEIEQMYRYMAIANYEDRFVIPTTHREYAENAHDLGGGCGFSFGNTCSDGQSEASLFGGKKRKTIAIKAVS